MQVQFRKECSTHNLIASERDRYQNWQLSLPGALNEGGVTKEFGVFVARLSIKFHVQEDRFYPQCEAYGVSEQIDARTSNLLDNEL